MSRNEIEPTTELGRRLEKERRNRGLTKEDWAEELNTSKPTYNAWLRGQEPLVINIRAIAKVMGMATVDVFLWVNSHFDEQREAGFAPISASIADITSERLKRRHPARVSGWADRPISYIRQSLPPTGTESS